MNERNTIHSRLPSAMHESEAGPHVYSSQTPAARAGDSRHESCHILVHTGDPMNGPFAALRPRGLSGGLISLAAAIALLYYGQLFLVTVCTAVIINFILEPFVGLLTRVRVPRALASFIVCSFAVCAVYFAGLGVYRQGATAGGGRAQVRAAHRRPLGRGADEAGEHGAGGLTRWWCRNA